MGYEEEVADVFFEVGVLFLLDFLLSKLVTNGA
jgi:hypothetical protein